MDKEELFKLVADEKESDVKKVSALMELSNIFLDEQNISESLKYAILASIVTFSPRADVCCLIGDRYFELSNATWAIKWYEMAISNYSNEIEYKYYTWLPLLKIAQVYLTSLQFEQAMKYIESAELLDKDNKDIQQVKNTINEVIKQYNKTIEK